MGLIPMSDFIEENSFSTQSLSRYIFLIAYGFRSRLLVRQKNPSRPSTIFSLFRPSLSTARYNVFTLNSSNPNRPLMTGSMMNSCALDMLKLSPSL